MFDTASLDKSLHPLQMFDDVLVCVLDVLSDKVRDLGGEPAHSVQRTDNLAILLDDSMSQTDTIVILSKVWGLK